MTDTERMLNYLKAHLPAARFNHTLGTCRVAADLARRYGVGHEKAMTAALLHDAGKGLSRPQMVAYARRHRLKIPFLKEVIRYNPSLLHSFISADIARRIFKITDRDILDAIALHTVGAPDMSTLSAVIYLADATAPDRRYAAVKKLRRMSRRNLERALTMAIGNKIDHVVRNRKWLHPDALATWNRLVTK